MEVKSIEKIMTQAIRARAGVTNMIEKTREAKLKY